MSILIDAILLGIIFLAAFISSKYGFVRTAIEIVGFIMIIIIVNSSSVLIAEGIYDSFVNPKITEATENISENTGNAANNYWNSLPSSLRTKLGVFGVTEDTIKNGYGESIKSGISKKSDDISKRVIKPLVVKPITLLVSIILFLLLNPLVSFIARILNKLVKKTFAKKLNSRLGFLIGIIKGILIATMVSLVFLAIVNLHPKGFWFITKNSIDKSFVVGIIRNYLPKNGILAFMLNA